MVSASKSGRNRFYQLEPEPIMSAVSWLDAYRSFWQSRMGNLDSSWMPEVRMIEAEFIDIVEEYDHPRAVVWRALTDSDALSRWLMPNDFKLGSVTGSRLRRYLFPLWGSTAPSTARFSPSRSSEISPFLV